MLILNMKINLNRLLKYTNLTTKQALAKFADGTTIITVGDV